MSYLGRGLEQVDNISKLDNITFNGGTTYALTKDSSAFTPISSNAILISIDGVIQQGNFSVSGTNIVFNFSPTSSNTCDFIMHYGTGVAFTPADSSITKDKANFISTSSSAGLQIKGDGTTDGTLQLNCSQNSHGIKLKSPSHSAGASYTLTFPTTDGNADEFLQTNGSGVLTWATAGGNNTPAFSAKSASQQSISNTTFTDVDFGTETFDTDNAFASSIFTVPSGKAGKYFLFAQAGRQVWDSDRFLTTIVRTPSGGSGEDIAVGETHDGEGYETTQAFCIADLSVGDAIKVQVYHDSGSTRNISSNFRTTFQGFKLL